MPRTRGGAETSLTRRSPRRSHVTKKKIIKRPPPKPTFYDLTGDDGESIVSFIRRPPAKKRDTKRKSDPPSVTPPPSVAPAPPESLPPPVTHAKKLQVMSLIHDEVLENQHNAKSMRNTVNPVIVNFQKIFPWVNREDYNAYVKRHVKKEGRANGTEPSTEDSVAHAPKTEDPPGLARVPSDEAETNVYETEASLSMYLGLHFPSSGQEEGVPNILPHENAPIHALGFPQRVAQLLTSLEPVCTNGKVLDVGCAVGGSSFELAKTYKHVDAFDFSDSFIQAAKGMQSGEPMAFRVPVEADLYEEVAAVLESDVKAKHCRKINFFVGDACKLSSMKANGTLDSYDGAILSNLLCRLPDPHACIRGLGDVINEGGVVVIVTPFSWLEEFTSRSKWLGGFYDPESEDPIRSKDALVDAMASAGFEKIHESEIPLVIREHQRKYQYIVSQATGWRKM